MKIGVKQVLAALVFSLTVSVNAQAGCLPKAEINVWTRADGLCPTSAINEKWGGNYFACYKTYIYGGTLFHGRLVYPETFGGKPYNGRAIFEHRDLGTIWFLFNARISDEAGYKKVFRVQRSVDHTVVTSTGHLSGAKTQGLNFTNTFGIKSIYSNYGFIVGIDSDYPQTFSMSAYGLCAPNL